MSTYHILKIGKELFLAVGVDTPSNLGTYYTPPAPGECYCEELYRLPEGWDESIVPPRPPEGASHDLIPMLDNLCNEAIATIDSLFDDACKKGRCNE